MQGKSVKKPYTCPVLIIDSKKARIYNLKLDIAKSNQSALKAFADS